MPREVLDRTEIYTVEWDGDIEAVVHTWEDFTSGAEYRDGCEAILDAIEARNASKLLVDTSGIQAHNDEDRQWLQTEWIPRAMDAGVEHSATVHRDSVISEMEIESMMEDMEDFPLDPLVTSDLGEARQWLAEK